ncbi:8-amino-3,8-dideoxy-manno-octulosonate cytidylyltransferase [bacterium HR40]|nr:8-amino-3,8-dideoxy-manno-octulosonate cytidylyltransferase [bacterium HR40]
MPQHSGSTDKRSRTAVLIPARLASARLPHKPLLDIAGEPMIVHVWRRAVAADIGPVWVACAEERIAEAVERAGGRAVLTDPALPSGTDRIHAALALVDPDRHFTSVVNLQGDMPTVDPACVAAVLEPLTEGSFDIATLIAASEDPEERRDPNVVKAIPSFPKPGARIGRALYFTRAEAPSGPGPIWHHIGIYAFRREVLERFAALPPSPLEKRERLEQLRALEYGMTIGVRVVESVPFGVDTPADLARARAILERVGERGSRP